MGSPNSPQLLNEPWQTGLHSDTIHRRRRPPPRGPSAESLDGTGQGGSRAGRSSCDSGCDSGCGLGGLRLWDPSHGFPGALGRQGPVLPILQMRRSRAGEVKPLPSRGQAGGKCRYLLKPWFPPHPGSHVSLCYYRFRAWSPRRARDLNVQLGAYIRPCLLSISVGHSLGSAEATGL